MAVTMFQNGQFDVNIEGMNVGQFVKVSGIGIDITPKFQSSEGKGVSISRRGEVRVREISLTREFDGSKELMKWIKDCSIRNPDNYKRNGSIIVKNDDGLEAIRYNFTAAWPISYQAPVFEKHPGKDFEGDDRALETVVLAIEDIDIA